MQQQMAAMYTQMQQQQLQLAAALARLPSGAPTTAPAVVSPPVASSARMKPPAMWRYSGKTAGVEVDRFVRDIEIQFRLCSVPEQDKIEWATAYFSDAAADWWAKESKVNPVASWDELVSRLNLRFRPIAAAVAARTQLRHLRQRGGVSGYATLFNSILSHITDMSEADQIYNFLEGLADREVVFRVKQQRLVTLSATVIAAVQAESDLGARGGHQSRQSYPSSMAAGHGTSSTTVPMDVSALQAESQHEYDDAESVTQAYGDNNDRAAPSGSTDSDRMDALIQKAVDARLAALQLPKSLSQSQSQSSRSNQDIRRNGAKFSAEKERLYNEGRCFKCKKKGHQSRECKADFQ